MSNKYISSRHRKLMVIMCAAATMSVIASRADAYIDPATGLVIWQAIFAAIGGVLMFVRNPIKFTKSVFNRLKNRKKSK